MSTTFIGSNGAPGYIFDNSALTHQTVIEPESRPLTGGRSHDIWQGEKQGPDAELLNAALRSHLLDNNFRGFAVLKAKYPNFRPRIEDLIITERHFIECDFSGCDFEDVEFDADHMIGADFSDSTFNEVVFNSSVKMANLDFSRSKLSNVRIELPDGAKELNFDDTQIKNMTIAGEGENRPSSLELSFVDACIEDFDSSAVKQDSWNFPRVKFLGNIKFGEIIGPNTLNNADFSEVESFNMILDKTKQLQSGLDINPRQTYRVSLRPNGSLEYWNFGDSIEDLELPEDESSLRALEDLEEIQVISPDDSTVESLSDSVDNNDLQQKPRKILGIFPRKRKG